MNRKAIHDRTTILSKLLHPNTYRQPRRFIYATKDLLRRRDAWNYIKTNRMKCERLQTTSNNALEKNSKHSALWRVCLCLYLRMKMTNCFHYSWGGLRVSGEVRQIQQRTKPKSISMRFETDWMVKKKLLPQAERTHNKTNINNYSLTTTTRWWISII